MASEQKHKKWLHEQLQHWVEKGFIDQAQSEVLRQNHPLASSNIGRMAFTGIGALVFGLGVILFFAYNWQDMHRYLKLAIIFGGIVLANLGAQAFAPDSGRPNKAANEGLALLGTVLFGAGIWLVSQIYHIDEHYPNAFAAWGLGALLMAWARQSWLQALAALALLSIWANLEYFSFGIARHSAPWVILLGLAPLAWRLRSRVLLFLSICAFYFFWIMDMGHWVGEHMIYAVFGIAAMLIALANLLSRFGPIDFPGIRYVIGLPGFIVYLAILFALTFLYSNNKPVEILVFDTPGSWVVYFASMLGALVLLTLVIFAERFIPSVGLSKLKRTDLFHAVLVLVATALVFTVLPGYIELDLVIISIMANLFIVGHCLVLIVNGSRDQRAWEVAVGCIMLVILVFARYTDLFDSLLARSAMFLLLGAGLFLVGSFYSRQKTEGVETDD